MDVDGTYSVQIVGTPVKTYVDAFKFIGVEDCAVIEVSPLQLAKAVVPIEVIELGSVSVLSPLQASKASFPIEVIELGSVIVVSPLQPKKASVPIEVTELGSVIEVSEVFAMG